MWATLGLMIAAAIGLTTVLAVSRRGSVHLDNYPWLLDEVSKLHVTIVGTLAGFAFTGIVLVVTLAHDRPGASEAALDTVVVMFLVAYLFWVGAAFLIAYLPHRSTTGDVVQRIHFSLATTIEYRTVFLSWFALLPLLEANGLGRLVPILYVLLPASLLLGSVLVAMTSDGLGVLRFRETYFSAVVGGGLALLYTAIVAVAAPGARSAYSALDVTLVLFLVNTAGFAFATLTPLSGRYPRVNAFYERHGRRIVIADMQLTMVSLAFLWLAVVRAV